MDQDERALMQRITRLERQNRRLSLLVIVVDIVCAGMFIMGQAPGTAESIDAERVVIRDGEGRMRAMLAYDIPTRKATRGAARPGPGLVLYDAEGAVAALLHVEENYGARLECREGSFGHDEMTVALDATGFPPFSISHHDSLLVSLDDQALVLRRLRGQHSVRLGFFGCVTTSQLVLEDHDQETFRAP